MSLKTLALIAPPIRRLWQDRMTLISQRDALAKANRELLLSLEAASKPQQNPFFHYNCSFDALDVLKRYEQTNLAADDTHVTNFLGVKISPRFFPGILDGKAGTIEPPPIPANWHADIAEWAAALRAVDLAEEKFRAVELGCGWGCWLNNTGMAARSRGLNVQLIGIEGDGDHVEFAKEALASNGFSSGDYRIIHGVAAPQKGTALFPVVENAGASWGSEPILNATDLQVREATASGQFQVLPALSLEEITLGEPIDLLHMDIQGGEADYVDATVQDLNRYVRYLVVGTHSRQIEGRIMSTLLANGWSLEMERPAIIGIVGGTPQIAVDGVQGWRAPPTVRH